jgi:hypothetical protein
VRYIVAGDINSPLKHFCEANNICFIVHSDVWLRNATELLFFFAFARQQWCSHCWHGKAKSITHS